MLIYIYRTQKGGENPQKRGFGYQHFHPKIGSAPLKGKKNILEYRVYCIQNDRLGHTVPTKQTAN